MAGDIGTDGATTTVGGEAAAITMVGGTIAIGLNALIRPAKAPPQWATRSRSRKLLGYRNNSMTDNPTHLRGVRGNETR